MAVWLGGTEARSSAQAPRPTFPETSRGASDSKEDLENSSMRLRVGKGAFLEVEKVTVGHSQLWVRKNARGRYWDIDVTRAILEGDEYQLEPLIAAGHRLRWVLDIGAHIGSFTLRVKKSWPEARVIAAEPDPDNAALFRRNTEGLDHVFLHEVAVLGSGRRGRAHLRQAGRVNRDRNATASWVAEAVQGLDQKANPPTITVDRAGIVDLLDRHGRPTIDLLKLDCEGAEGEILLALARVGHLERVNWIRGEWHFHQNIGRIEQALRQTHTFHIHQDRDPWGGFIAHRKMDG